MVDPAVALILWIHSASSQMLWTITHPYLFLIQNDMCMCSQQHLQCHIPQNSNSKNGPAKWNLKYFPKERILHMKLSLYTYFNFTSHIFVICEKFECVVFSLQGN